jgi:hypothetical protein
MFKGRLLMIATKHEKEKIISPIFEKEIGVQCLVPENIDTDLLGTFTGEVERKYDPITTARHKCEMAMRQTNASLAIASEGSFGPHPSIFFVNANEEILVFIDKENDLEIIAKEISTSTNFNASLINNLRELKSFANKVGFPSHGLILRPSKENVTVVFKGITSWIKLIEKFNYLVNNYGNAYIETDMRAMYNPTRRANIQIAANKLIEKIKTTCPECNTPGFGVTRIKEGLPCSFCKAETRSVKSHIYSCQKCKYEICKDFPYDKIEEDPMYCDQCNP